MQSGDGMPVQPPEYIMKQGKRSARYRLTELEYLIGGMLVDYQSGKP